MLLGSGNVDLFIRGKLDAWKTYVPRGEHNVDFSLTFPPWKYPRASPFNRRSWRSWVLFQTKPGPYECRKEDKLNCSSHHVTKKTFSKLFSSLRCSDRNSAQQIIDTNIGRKQLTGLLHVRILNRLYRWATTMKYKRNTLFTNRYINCFKGLNKDNKSRTGWIYILYTGSSNAFPTVSLLSLLSVCVCVCVCLRAFGVCVSARGGLCVGGCKGGHLNLPSTRTHIHFVSSFECCCRNCKIGNRTGSDGTNCAVSKLGKR